MNLVKKLLLLLLSLMTFGCSCNKEASKEKKTVPMVKIQESCKSKEMKVGPMFTSYEMDYAYDHSIIYNPEQKKWHMYGIPSDHSYFIHLTADSLTQRGWEKEAPFKDKGQSIWAPHIIKHEDMYYMFYTSIGVPREIKLATSKDLKTWKHIEKPLFAWKNEVCLNMKNKDPMVFWDENKEQWVMYVSMLKDAKHWVVGYATSKDLYNWSEPGICFDENTESPGVESPFVVKERKVLLFISFSSSLAAWCRRGF